MSSNYLDYLYNLGIFNIKLGLTTISRMLERLGNLHHHPRIIHIAGTNGKGSTLVTLEKLLLENGFSTGSTISPHLISFNERFRINAIQVEDSDLDYSFKKVCQACGIKPDLSMKGSEDGKINPTFFEFSLAMAFVLFHKYKVDYILLETGLGGRLDATNIIPQPLACIITRIAIDHQEFLGDTIEEITGEKLGILKPETPAFFAAQEATVLGQVKKQCGKMNIPHFYCPDSFGFKAVENSELTEFYFKSELIPGSKEKEERLLTLKVNQPGLIGNHQKENIAVALATYFYLVPERSRLSKKEIEKVIRNLKWQGRLQYLGDSKRILIDGAHNVSGIKALLEYLAENHSDKKILFAIGWKRKKEILSAFAGFIVSKTRFLPLQMKSEESEKVKKVTQALKNNGLNTEPSMDVRSFVKKVVDGFWVNYDLLVIAGSLYLLGEFLEEWESKQTQFNKLK